MDGAQTPAHARAGPQRPCLKDGTPLEHAVTSSSGALVSATARDVAAIRNQHCPAHVFLPVLSDLWGILPRGESQVLAQRGPQSQRFAASVASNPEGARDAISVAAQ